MSVEAVDPGRDRATRIRRILGRVLRDHLEGHGPDIAGFALVSWDMRGNARTGFMTEVGPVGDSLMPCFVKDALQRHLAVKLAQIVTPSIIDSE